ncbi:MAG: hypothetical protein M3Y87_30460 [Myxococcota bacterium]|nr:hypothetical protein [Myxococcota bacterium]
MSRPTHVVCLSCHHGQQRALSTTLLGFRSFRCERCDASSTYPLSTAYVIAYGASFAVCLMALIARRGVACFLVLAIVAAPIIALDLRARRRAQLAKTLEKDRGAEPVV